MKKSVVVPIGLEGGRDVGKVFVIVEPGALRRETWMRHAITTVLRCGIEAPGSGAQGGPIALDALDVPVLLRALGDDVDGLYAELLRCVKIRPDASKPMALRDTVEDDFEELKTLVRLRMEAFQMMTGFRLPAVLWARFSGLPVEGVEDAQAAIGAAGVPAWADMAVYRA